MFTTEQIKAEHAKMRSGADYPQYVQNIKKLGVEGYETFVSDRHTNYYGANSYMTASPPFGEALTVADKSDASTFESGLRAHQRGETDFTAFCRLCAETGVEKWVVSTEAMTCTYYDKAGNSVFTEKIAL